ncbi:MULTISPECIES: sigma-70 family RNA polymerase sigma factor [unclassified Streptomyces]|uniref:sigma-70 family RNA polymerase sigma factor n=1 Tax=unclassified Streptomyces TaxID=2593676 RepID=UPI0036E4A86F
MGWTVMGAAEPGEDGQYVLAGYIKHVPALYTYVCRLTGGDRYWAEDVVQETLLRCWTKYRHREGGLLRPWLFTVARNLVIDDYRRNTARPQEVDVVTRLDQKACERDDIERMLTSLVVAESLQTLSPGQRETLRETYLLGKSIEETARTLGIPVGTAKSRIHYGLRALRLALQERGLSPRQVLPAAA